MHIHIAKHLSRDKRIKLGGYYTPESIVKKVHEFIKPYLESKQEVVILDSAGGCGAFIFNIKNYDYRIADCDLKACEFLEQHFDKNKIFYTNSLENVNRKKFSIDSFAYLIIIGNPPYNDTTSEFKSGQKGRNVCDLDLYDRDIGISFLKSYHKLNADIICVLHPLSYLIKETNFKRLKTFRDNYKLIKGEIFPSSIFYATGNNKFPVVIALYEKTIKGMTFDYIKNFCFDILDSQDKFILSEFTTTDGYINKYPPRKNDVQESPIDLYYYSFRDINSLKKNASFMIKKHVNGIIVTLENLYKYCYLYAFKKLFNPDNLWLYGNLSPLLSKRLEQDKNLYVLYALKTNKIFSHINTSILHKICTYYKINLNSQNNISIIEKKIKNNLLKTIKTNQTIDNY